MCELLEQNFLQFCTPFRPTNSANLYRV